MAKVLKPCSGNIYTCLTTTSHKAARIRGMSKPPSATARLAQRCVLSALSLRLWCCRGCSLVVFPSCREYSAQSIHQTAAMSFFDTTYSGTKEDEERAAKWLVSLKKRCHTLLDRGDKEQTAPIKIAVLDTGIDTKHVEIEKDIGDIYWDVCDFRNGQTTQTMPNGEDKDGHGTHVAALLARVAPYATIYIAKVAGSTSDLNVADVARVREVVAPLRQRL